MESISQLKRICQETRDDVLYQRNWFDKNITRGISIYFTKLFLKIGISANQATLVDFFIGVAAGAFLISTNPKYWLIGILLFYLYFVFDCVDGEIARYNKSSSPVGSFLDGGLGVFMWPYILACMTFGIYGVLHSTIVFVFGFISGIGWLLYTASALFSYPILHSWGSLSEAVETSQITKEFAVMRYGRIIFGTRGFIPALLIVTLIDCFVSPFTAGPFIANARFIYLIIFGMAAVAGIVVRVWGVTHYGVKLEKP